MYKNLKELITATRSYRGYDHSFTIDRETLADFVDHARLSAASMNVQPLKYYLVYEPEMVDRIQPNTGWARQLPEAHLPHPGKEPSAFIAICQDTTIDENLNRYQRDLGIVGWSMQMAATERGLAGIMLGTFNAGAVAEIMNLPDHIKPLLMVAFGKPDEKIVLTDVVDGKFKYYRDENDVHYVPKRSLEEIILN